MFALGCFAVFTVAYALSALACEFVFTSPQEHELPGGVRAGLGFVFLVTYFGGLWALVSVQNAWLLGSPILILYWIATRRAAPAGEWRRRLEKTLRAHAAGYLACLGAVVVFFAPLALALKSGPFTEGGGDVSIYADGTKYLVDHGLTAKGMPGALDDLRDNAKDPTLFTLDGTLAARLAMERYIAADRARINPPAADHPVYRMLTLQSMSSFLYAPYGLFFFLAGSTNYHVYYGVQAFVYAVLAVCAWSVFRRHGRSIALLYTGLVVGSQGLVAVYYNMYSAQAISVAICALTLALVSRIRALSWAGVRVYGITSIYLLVSYVHFLSVTVPLLAVALMSWRGAAAPLAVHSPSGTRRLRFLRWPAMGLLWGVVALPLLPAMLRAVFIVIALGSLSITTEQNVYLGDHVAAFSPDWWSFLSGVVSQQHLRPLAAPHVWLMVVIYSSAAIGALAFVLGPAVAARTCRAADRDAGEARRLLVTYGVLLLTAAMHVVLTRNYLYTQAKGAQDVLPLVYAALVAPLAAGTAATGRDATLRILVRALGASIVIFLAALLAVRGIYAYRLAHELDRSSILGPSYFAEARKIRAEDPQAFVLFEPRRSADLYVSVQPFAGARMVSTRHLGLKMLVFNGGPPDVKRVDASDLLHDSDLPHVWTLSAARVDGGDRWKAERLAARSTPALLLFADDYEQDFGRKARSGRAGDEGMFSYMRNGSAMLYLPPGAAHQVEVTLMARDPSGHDPLLRELKEKLAAGELAGELVEEGATMHLRRSLAARAAPQLLTIARLGGEYWLNVRLDGKDVLASDDAAAGMPSISGIWINEFAGATAIRATWSGMRATDHEDWIGVFPVGGPDSTRRAFGYTGGREDGSITIPLPRGASDGAYEVRLYRGGSWNVLATSGPIHP